MWKVSNLRTFQTPATMGKIGNVLSIYLFFDVRREIVQLLY